MKNLAEKCPFCNSAWTEDTEIKEKMWNSDKNCFKSAYSFESCYRKCLNDKVAVSNAKKPKIIFQNYERNVPLQLESENQKLLRLLDNCLNLNHRQSKKFQFSFFRSEDAFTWAYFGYICKNGLQEKLQKALNLSASINDILFWGTSFNITDDNHNREALIAASDLCNEDEQYRSEPDIIICSSKEIVFVEVKVDSNNPKLSDSELYKAEKYRQEKFYTNFDRTKRLYELVRNWSIGNLMAEAQSKEFKLCNLMPAVKIKSEEKSSAQKNFKEGINNNSAYSLISWEDLFECVDSEYKEYLNNRMNEILKM